MSCLDIFNRESVDFLNNHRHTNKNHGGESASLKRKSYLIDSLHSTRKKHF